MTPDYILIGTVGDAGNIAAPPRHFVDARGAIQLHSMWSLMAAPLIFSGDMTGWMSLPSMLCNSEVIDIDQDSWANRSHRRRRRMNSF